MAQPTEITVTQLARLIGTPDCPVLVDVRIDADVNADPVLIPGAFRHPFDSVEALLPRLAGRQAVIICQRGAKLSAGAAALLRCHGIAAENLVGGTLGWADAGLPTVAQGVGTTPGTLWVTRQRPKIDRIACPWLIRRFVDPGARFLFVPASDVSAVAEKFGALAFDTEDAPFTHVGPLCTFDALLAAFGLRYTPLDRLAALIRAADTDRCADVPEAAGLLAASLGLSRQYRSDLAQLDAGLGLYDAFFRWARDAQDERHDWTGKGGPA